MGKKKRRFHGSGPEARDEAERFMQGWAEEPAALADLTTKEVGDLGEMLASLYLEERGYDILEHNYRCPEGEADLVAYDNGTEEVVLVEVKARRSDGRGDELFPEEAVGRNKRRRYRRIASCFMMDRFPVCSVRFDVIAVTLVSDEGAALQHLCGAFEWEAD